MSGILRKLKHFDAYPKTLEDFRVKTFSGAAITILCFTTIIGLFISEWIVFLQKDVQQELFVDTSIGGRMRINLDIVFPHLHCDLLSVDMMDVSGEEQTDVVKGIRKRYLDLVGQDITEQVEDESRKKRELEKKVEKVEDSSCLSCYGAETAEQPCCNTCADVQKAYASKHWKFVQSQFKQCNADADQENHKHMDLETMTDTDFEKVIETGGGCRIHGHLEPNKVAGSFHIAPGTNKQDIGGHSHGHAHDLKISQAVHINTTHTLNTLYFGSNKYPEQVNPLDNTVRLEIERKSATYRYFIKIVPTTYVYENGQLLTDTYQYSVTKSHKFLDAQDPNGVGLPGVVFQYELSPIMVKFIEKPRSLTHFLTSCCAIVGGIFTVAGLLDAFVFKYRNLYLKSQINKLT